jgi:hypothetical protein
MNTSDTIAALALVISLVSFWLSYRAAQLAKTVSAAEKRTQAHSILVSALLEVQELLALIRGGVMCKESDATLVQGLNGIEDQFIRIDRVYS